ncbi:excalibur calcium-binding domain-containing protein [Streptomyces anulatus]|uniref:excalibur calcium-binding domain-containing protein n=1 Tax=Streptomyces anulatus TaxID=1892 RepID=UPI002257190E|nr:excalibur calcium-binding domain-containing protein [Streptomyces anulatus]MCX4484908.1 excalibur calcium-binding domain-containing protein [Streptomyces anulatus]MCX4518557.1 excalibur calcium-binding domain-containing protein [Streptomyces anulatus]WSI77784.1 excalibur calcium-binding domain-containing protein [Streptomyces anulatus]WSU73831.1 excalibur calcium-binding domain-containing protein [Streptomyces anulatus]WTD10092.1 excalibur calcium-binding domain-containing protein [Streptom
MQTRKQSRRPRRGVLRIRISAGAGALALILTGCGGDDGTTDDRGGKVAASVGPSASVERALALMDDEQSVDAGNSLDVDVLDNDSVTLENGERAALLHTYDPAELTLSIDTEPAHGSASVSGTTVTYNARDGYAGEDELTYEVLVKGTEVPAATAVVRITVTAAAPEATPTANPTPAGNASKPPKATDPAPAYYENCDAARAAGAAPVEEGDPGYAPHLDRDGDGVGCEPWGESAASSGGGGTSGGSGGGGGGSVSYANCTAVRNAGAAPIRTGDPGYGRHLDRDGDGVGCE